MRPAARWGAAAGAPRGLATNRRRSRALIGLSRVLSGTLRQRLDRYANRAVLGEIGVGLTVTNLPFRNLVSWACVVEELKQHQQQERRKKQVLYWPHVLSTKTASSMYHAVVRRTKRMCSGRRREKDPTKGRPFPRAASSASTTRRLAPQALPPASPSCSLNSSCS